jgi:uncharacterized protein (DUF1778 family)
MAKPKFKQLAVRVTVEDLGTLEKAAKDLGLPITSYIRMAALEKARSDKAA